MAKNNSEESNFQLIIDGMKQQKITWTFFVDLIQNLSYSDIGKLRNLNAILLMELTMNFSDLDRLRYLNEILLIQFKNYIDREQDNLEDSNDNPITNEETTKEVVANEDVEQPIMDEMTKNDPFEEKTTEILTNENIQMPILNEVIESNYFEETTPEVLTKEDIQILAVDEIRKDLISSCKEEIIECNSSNENNSKIFHCYICNKEYNLYFHLKQHIKKVHEKTRSHNVHHSLVLYDQKRNENEIAIATKSIGKGKNLKTCILVQDLKKHIYSVHEGQKDHKCESCEKSFSRAQTLKRHIHTVHEGHKDYKCESCGKSFSQAGYLKTHIHTVHEGHKNCKCEYCSRSFSHAGELKRHIHTVHKGHKDYKCNDCGKSFTTLTILEKHLHTVHDGYKDHKCESCGKSFSQAGGLKNHKCRVHGGHKD